MQESNGLSVYSVILIRVTRFGNSRVNPRFHPTRVKSGIDTEISTFWGKPFAVIEDDCLHMMALLNAGAANNGVINGTNNSTN